MQDPVHRLLNAIEPDSYIQPHRHLSPPRHETLAVLRGRGAVLVFEETGMLLERATLSPTGPDQVVELEAGAWHSLVSLEPGMVWFEVKEGPYAPPPPADVARFAPAPNSPEAAAYLEQMRKLALVG